jgi:hypothetical protein
MPRGRRHVYWGPNETKKPRSAAQRANDNRRRAEWQGLSPYDRAVKMHELTKGRGRAKRTDAQNRELKIQRLILSKQAFANVGIATPNDRRFLRSWGVKVPMPMSHKRRLKNVKRGYSANGFNGFGEANPTPIRRVPNPGRYGAAYGGRAMPSLPSQGTSRSEQYPMLIEIPEGDYSQTTFNVGEQMGQTNKRMAPTSTGRTLPLRKSKFIPNY